MKKAKHGPLYSYVLAVGWTIIFIELWDMTCAPEYALRPFMDKVTFFAACAVSLALAVYDLVDGIIKQIKKGME